MMSLAMTNANTVENETTPSQKGNLVNSFEWAVIVENGIFHDQGFERNISGRLRKKDKNEERCSDGRKSGP